MIRKICSITWFLLLFAVFLLQAQNFVVPITVTDGTHSQVVKIGVNPAGSDGYDSGLDVIAPIMPPAGAFGTRLEVNNEGYFTDVRDNALTQKSYLLEQQPAAGGSISLNWDNTILADLGTFTIVDDITGTLFTLDMSTTNSLVVTGNPLIEEKLRILVTPSLNPIDQETGDLPQGDPPQADFPGADISLDFSDCPGGHIQIDYYNNPPQQGLSCLDKYWDVTSDMTNGTFLVDLIFYYTDEELADLGITESEIFPYYYNELLDDWVPMAPTDFAVDVVNNTVTILNLDHFTLFALGFPNQGASFTAAGIKAFLQGPYNNGTMATTLRDAGYLPLQQPYSGSPWNYNGTESVTTIPADVVDWVLVELRTSTDASTKVATRAAFVKSNGDVVDIDGVSPVLFEGVDPADYYIVIYHRNHLSIMCSSAQNFSLRSTTTYDFTQALSSAYQTTSNPLISLGTNKWGLFAGEGNNSGIVTIADRNDALGQRDFVGYSVYDYNLSGIVTMSDVNLSLTNRDANTQVP